MNIVFRLYYCYFFAVAINIISEEILLFNLFLMIYQNFKLSRSFYQQKKCINLFYTLFYINMGNYKEYNFPYYLLFHMNYKRHQYNYILLFHKHNHYHHHHLMNHHLMNLMFYLHTN